MALQRKSQRKFDFIQNFEVNNKEFLESKVSVEEVEEDRLETVSALPEHEIYGFDNEISLLQNFLLDQKVYDEFKSLVVVGEYGVGKTTLCKMIFNKDEVKSVYAPRIWVSMHSKQKKEREENKISVLKRILKGLGVEDSMLESIHSEAVEVTAPEQEAGEINGEMSKELELSVLLYAVNLHLRWKKYLIVIDDVRGEDNWNEKLDEELKEDEEWGKHLSDGFPKGSGGRVIYTTRDETLAKKLVADEHEIHRLWPLSDPENVQMIYEDVAIENKKLYGEAAKENKKVYEEAGKENKRELLINKTLDKAHQGNEKKFKEELMNKSRGIPLAARMMAMSNPVFKTKEKRDSANNSISEKDCTQALKA